MLSSWRTFSSNDFCTGTGPEAYANEAADTAAAARKLPSFPTLMICLLALLDARRGPRVAGEEYGLKGRELSPRPRCRRGLGSRSRRWHSRLLGPNQAQLFTQLRVDLLGHIRVFAQELLGVIATLPDALALVAVPGAALLDQVMLHAQVDQVAFLGDTLAIDNVELGFAERRRHLIFDDLDLGAVAGDRFAVLDGG